MYSIFCQKEMSRKQKEVCTPIANDAEWKEMLKLGNPFCELSSILIISEFSLPRMMSPEEKQSQLDRI